MIKKKEGGILYDKFQTGKVFWIDRDKLNEYTLAEGFDGMFEVFANDNLSENYHWFENNEWNMENK